MISEINIVPIKPNNGLLGFASVVLDDKVYLGSIAVHAKLDGSGLRLTYPTKKVGSKNMDIFHPIKKELSKEIEKAVFQKFKNVMNKVDDGYGSAKYS